MVEQVKGQVKEMALDVIEQLYTVLLLTTVESNLTIYNLDLPASHYQVVRMSDTDAAGRRLADGPVDAVITDNSPAALDFIRENYLHSENGKRPLICVICTHAPPTDNLPDVDILLPPVPGQYLHHQLQAHFQHRQKLADLEKNSDEIALLKNAIVQNVSHELKTPLLQVKSAVALIAEDAKDNSLSQMAVTATTRLEMIIKNITLLAGSMNGDMSPVLVSESVDLALRNLRRSWLHKDDTDRVERHIMDGLPPVHANKQGLSIVMQQLIDNALKFSKGGGQPVEVYARQTEDGIYIAVKDYGIGIAEDKLKQIFDTFYQIDSSSTRKYGGTGVGLAIVRLILEKHNVAIHVESALGEGSTFSFTLKQAQL